MPVKLCSISNNLDKPKNNYLFMDQSDSDEEDETEFNDVPEVIIRIVELLILQT